MAKCPICKSQATDPKTRPFCSRRCADIDLNAWFSGRYAIPAADQSPDEEGADDGVDR